MKSQERSTFVSSFFSKLDFFYFVYLFSKSTHLTNQTALSVQNNYHFLKLTSPSGSILSLPAYGVLISQLKRYTRTYTRTPMYNLFCLTEGNQHNQ